MSATDLAITLSEWRSSEPALNSLIDRSPALREAKPLAADLGNLGTTGLEALSYLQRNVPPPNGWREGKLVLLDGITKPKAALEFPTVPGVKKLVIAAAEQSELKNMSALDWKKRVVTIATSPAK